MDEDIAFSLPEPPPPAPARRQGAIEAALRRYDGIAEAAPLRAPDRRRGGWWTSLSRPQLGWLASIVLVAMVGAPAAWISIDRQPGAPPAANRVRAVPVKPQTGDVGPSADRGSNPPEAIAAPNPLPAIEKPPPCDGENCRKPGAVSERPDIKAADAAIAPAPPPPPPAAALADQALATPAESRSASPPSPAAQPDFQGRALSRLRTDPSRKENSGQAAETQPVPAPDESSIVVTGARRSFQSRPGRGAWNACTTDDPRPNIAGCRKRIEAQFRGSDPRAAALATEGLAAAWSGDYREAISAFDRAVALAPRTSFAYLNRGLAYRRLGELDRALADLDQAVRHGRLSPQAYYNRSLLLRQRGDTRRAEADEDRALDLDPNYTDALP